MSRRRLRLVAASVVVLLAAACSSGSGGAIPTDSAGPSSAPARGARASRLEWQPCGRIECATLSVPLDHTRPDGPKVRLALGRRAASSGDPVGTLVVNPGGPGGSGLDLVEAADQIFGREVLDRFDVVGWDPRGVGRSTPVDCVDDLDAFFAVDHSPDDAAEVRNAVDQAKRFVAGCESRSRDLLPHLSTTETVHDLDAIRAAVGDPRLTYLGFSYGTYIGARYAEAFPRRVRALVLDGAVDPSLTAADLTRQQAVGLETELRSFFAWCDANRSACVFGDGHTAPAYDALMTRIDAHPIADGGRFLGPGEADVAVAWTLYRGEEGWPVLAQMLAAAARGKGAALLATSDSYTGRQPDGSYDNEQEAFYATGCVDAPAPRSVRAVEALAARVARDSPHFGVTTAWLGLPCTFWPVRPDQQPREIHAPRAPRILVLGTTGDPATPLAWARALVRQLDSATLLVFDGHGHTAAGRGNACVDAAVNDYLVYRTLPEAGTVCHE